MKSSRQVIHPCRSYLHEELALRWRTVHHDWFRCHEEFRDPTKRHGCLPNANLRAICSHSATIANLDGTNNFHGVLLTGTKAVMLVICR